MKTLCFSLLLLVVIFYCVAMPQAVQEMGRARCCAVFRSERIPTKKIVSITKTHISCMKKGFIVKTEQGKFFCYNRTSKWVESLYNLQLKTNGSRQKN